MSRRCSDPDCDSGHGGKPAKVSRRFRMCRKCRAFAAVKKGAQRAREKLALSDGNTGGNVPEKHGAAHVAVPQSSVR